MDYTFDKAKQALLQLPEEAVSYLFPLLHERDIPKILGLESVSYSLSRAFPPEPKSYCAKELPSRNTRKRSLTKEEEELREDDERGQRIRAAIARVLEEYNVTTEELREYIGFPAIASHLRITRSGQILLTDFGNREVKMDTLSKVIFIFYLRHPEGVAFNELWDHREEMLFIYGRLTRRLDIRALEESIDRLCNTVEKNSINEKVSRVKRAFLNAVEEDIASQYYIKGPAGGIRKIELRRDLVHIQLLF